MHGLAEFQHDIIGDIHDGAQTAQSTAPQALLHPQGCRCLDVDAADHAPEVLRTTLRGLHIDSKTVFNGDGLRRDLNGRYRTAQQGTHLTRDAFYAQAITAVRSQVNLDDGVIKPQQLLQ